MLCSVMLCYVMIVLFSGMAIPPSAQLIKLYLLCGYGFQSTSAAFAEHDSTKVFEI